MLTAERSSWGNNYVLVLSIGVVGATLPGGVRPLVESVHFTLEAACIRPCMAIWPAVKVQVILNRRPIMTVAECYSQTLRAPSPAVDSTAHSRMFPADADAAVKVPKPPQPHAAQTPATPPQAQGLPLSNNSSISRLLQSFQKTQQWQQLALSCCRPRGRPAPSAHTVVFAG